MATIVVALMDMGLNTAILKVSVYARVVTPLIQPLKSVI
jgi:hypothetical protein